MSKFKLHWGWSILLVYATFVLVFVFFFYKSFIEAESKDFVVEDYYKKELAYGDVMAKKKNADTMQVQVKIINNNGITVVFPNYIKTIKGTLMLYKPDNKKLDRTIPISLQENKQHIDMENLVSGRWNVILDWKIDDTSYFVEKELFVN